MAVIDDKKSMYYDNLEEAASFNTVIRRFKLEGILFRDAEKSEVDTLIDMLLMKKLTTHRDNLLHQALNGLKDDTPSN